MITRLTVCFCLIATKVIANEGLDWPAYGGSPGGGHYSTAVQITPENVADLEIAWVHRSGDVRKGAIRGLDGFSGDSVSATAFIGTPIMVKDTLYYCTPFNRVFALEPATGREKWVFDPGVNMEGEALTNCRAVSSWVDSEASEGDFCAHRIIVPTLDGRIIAIDGETGDRCDSFGDNGQIDLTDSLTAQEEPSEYGITSAPAILNGILVTGSYNEDSIRNDIPSGVVRAYDLRTGDFLWGWNPVPPGMDQKDEDGNYLSGTTNVWSTISVDQERNLVIVPTGNSSPDYYGGDRGGNLDYYSSSVVALDGTTGEVVWHYQTVHHDIWDYDVPAQPTLTDIEVDGKLRPAVVQVTKMGLTFILDRETGEPLFPVEERPVPQTGAVDGEYLSPTQPFPVKPEPLHQLGISPDDAWGFTFIDRGWCRKKLQELTTGPIYTPISTKGTIIYPSIIGGNNWGAPAIDPERNIMVANTHHVASIVKLVPREQCSDLAMFPQRGSKYCATLDVFLSNFGAPCTKPPWATLSGVNLTTGKIEWQVPFGTLKYQAFWPLTYMKGGVHMGGPIVTASGLVFIAAAADRGMRAFDITNGEELWSNEMPTTGNAVPMTYMSEGKQFVVIAAGGHFTSPSPPGDYVIAYSLPDKI